jgi:glutamate synthase domain-containing protein 3
VGGGTSLPAGSTERTNEKKKDPKEINDAIKDLLSKSSRIKISGLEGQYGIGVGLKGKAEINVSGTAGNYLGAFNDGPVIVMNGETGDMAADGLFTGGLIIFGNCGKRCGCAMRGGILVIKGSADSDLASHNLNGTIIVDGDVKGDMAPFMEGGTVIVTGKVKGTIGRSSTGGIIFLSHKLSETEHNVRSSTISQKERENLRRYFEHYAINALPDGFQKYILGNGGGEDE